MPDISMCLNHECPRKETCWRYVAPPCHEWQSYGLFEHEDCKDYWPVDNNGPSARREE